ncbi:hypothetical protein HBB16_08730 [Pseudonocardia sp. MCCB 268]|nr:hypothetical protein [Pseudonocardia cytotoxica]
MILSVDGDYAARLHRLHQRPRVVDKVTYNSPTSRWGHRRVPREPTAGPASPTPVRHAEPVPARAGAARLARRDCPAGREGLRQAGDRRGRPSPAATR